MLTIYGSYNLTLWNNEFKFHERLIGVFTQGIGYSTRCIATGVYSIHYITNNTFYSPPFVSSITSTYMIVAFYLSTRPIDVFISNNTFRDIICGFTTTTYVSLFYGDFSSVVVS